MRRLHDVIRQLRGTPPPADPARVLREFAGHVERLGRTLRAGPPKTKAAGRKGRK
jgi:hypothetical protein